ncbi:demethoxyubiquinone hydroxylase family protein [Acidocella sp.]|uniref:demethoxyubiquinone hydroxylase family protein n=1 Tax=Acidocella sp. TaxID=50710 RepID=UPI003D0581F3
MSEQIKRFVRVDHAGEYGAERIYAGQIAVLGRGAKGDLLRHMLDQETVHKETFETLIAERRSRPTAMLPIWHVAGFALGAITAAMGEKAAMACTVAVEETIDAHYADQRDRLGPEETDLSDTIEAFRLEEVQHRDIGLENGAEQAPAYKLLTGLIKLGCKAAIRISEAV